MKNSCDHCWAEGGMTNELFRDLFKYYIPDLSPQELLNLYTSEISASKPAQVRSCYGRIMSENENALIFYHAEILRLTKIGNNWQKFERKIPKKKIHLKPLNLDPLGFDLFYFSITHRGWDRRQSERKGRTCSRFVLRALLPPHLTWGSLILVSCNPNNWWSLAPWLLTNPNFCGINEVVNKSVLIGNGFVSTLLRQRKYIPKYSNKRKTRLDLWTGMKCRISEPWVFLKI